MGVEPLPYQNSDADQIQTYRCALENEEHLGGMSVIYWLLLRCSPHLWLNHVPVPADPYVKVCTRVE
jgi:hypothetical protein